MLQPETSVSGGGRMVQLLKQKPVPEYRILDNQGRAIGRVVEPAAPIRMGMGRETVLLIR